MTDDKKALIALMDLVLALADYATTPPGHREKATERVQGHATRLRQELAVSQDGAAARTAVAATERRYDRMWGLRREMDKSVVDLGANREPIEADDSRITDGHKCCGGKPDCGCARSVGG